MAMREEAEVVAEIESQYRDLFECVEDIVEEDPDEAVELFTILLECSRPVKIRSFWLAAC